MDERELQSIIASLDAAVEKDCAVVRLHQYGGGPDESQITANETGYLRLGIEFLKAAFTEKDASLDDGNSIEIDLEYMISDDSDIGFDWFERDESLKPIIEQQDSWGSQLVGFTIFASFFGVVALAIYGALTLFGLLN